MKLASSLQIHFTFLLPLIFLIEIVKKEISVFNGGPWGSWGSRSNCAAGTRAVGFSLKVDPEHTGINGIRLICSDNKIIESTTHKYKT